MPRYFALLLGILLSFSAASIQAETRYVTDDLSITLRSGASNQHRILRTLPAGEKVEVLEADKATGYTRVSVRGTEGWVLTRYLSRSPSARDQLESAINTAEKLKKENEELKARFDSLSGESGELNNQLNEYIRNNKELNNELAEIRRKAARTLAIDQENKTLKKQLLDFENEIQSLRQQNDDLRDSTGMDWFVRGAGVLVGGVIIGIVLPRLRVRKRSSWDTF